ncbi:unnamed protein product [Rotaria sp. Silwood2]|nr:unnamed protein product [Rotaria sp. Silwood2]CAF2683662.1 unnamed protein product [Rotaria sp. Silwood2]CAF2956440.1 unnamed protein product [Rotaria sp. Silwood2]CAF3273080.1 unnamed protein product [Rotaria sp. Silwood2]CAF3995912.1 unnamed protein product [Rotaria sp. Silwood2]
MPLLITIACYVTIYIGIFIYIFGFFGSLLNIRILFSNRHNPCTFLLIYASIVDCIVLNIGLLPRIFAVGFSTDLTLSNLLWCKIRTYLLRISTLISLYSICLMSIDRYFISCRTVRWRQLSNIHFVRWITFLVSFLIATEGLPFLILTKILQTNNNTSCTPMYNSIFSKYASFFCIPILYGILPLYIMIIMSILIYHKLHNRTHLRRAQRSLTLIILLRILLALIFCGPYTSYFVYSAISILPASTKSAERIAIENFILSILSVFLYITYSSSFFVHFFISATYRKQLIDLFKYYRGRHRVVIQPMQMVLVNFIQNHAQTVINNKQNNETI